eukprot:1367202-Rhodomonas_salina.3
MVMMCCRGISQSWKGASALASASVGRMAHSPTVRVDCRLNPPTQQRKSVTSHCVTKVRKSTKRM